MRVLLESLPQFYNWQIAFQSAFRADFPRPLDVEKWWALQLAGFTMRDPGPLWTPEASRARLDQLLSVPVEARAGSNSLPAHAEISLQTVIRGMDFDQQTTILRTRLHDLGLAQYRMTPQFATLAAEYRRALANYLGENTVTITASTRQRPPVHQPVGDECQPDGEKTGRIGCAAAEHGINRPARNSPPAGPGPLKFWLERRRLPTVNLTGRKSNL